MPEKDALMLFKHEFILNQGSSGQLIDIFIWNKCCNNGCIDKNVFTLADQDRQEFCYLITMTKKHKYHKACSVVRKLNRKGTR